MENPEAQKARNIIENTGIHLFLTGKAGTGKTTFLKRLREDSPKRMVVLAPTGIAAINAGGVTLHSFFQLPFAPYVPDAHYSKDNFKLNKQKVKLIRSIDLVVIDEISMVRADLLDNVDAVLRRYRDRSQPFGGVQLLMIGDLQQLAPVVKEEEWTLLSKYYDTPFFFGSRALRETKYVTIELKHVYRQSDPDFIALLNSVRCGRTDGNTLQCLKARYIPDFTPKQEEGYIRLVTHNRLADSINTAELERLPGTPCTYKATVSGTFPESSYPTDAQLCLKQGAQIMFVKNNAEKRYFNGMIGKVVSLSKNGFKVQPTGQPGVFIDVTPDEWTNARYVLNEETKEVEETIDGTFRQYPVRLAWAITIHKSQGLTFERAIIDAHSAFAHGQTYVALSRCKSLEGLVLSSPIPPEAIITDGTVNRYTEEMTRHVLDQSTVRSYERGYLRQTVGELFDFHHIRFALDGLLRLMEESFYRLYPAALEEMRTHHKAFTEDIEQVAQKFQLQLDRLIGTAEHEPAPESTEAMLQERIHKGTDYFYTRLHPIKAFAENLRLPTDNKLQARRTKEHLMEVKENLHRKCRLLAYCREKGFTLIDYLHERAIASTDEIKDNAKVSKGKSTGKKPTAHTAIEQMPVPSDILHKKLYSQLIAWRYQKSKDTHLPAYTILHQIALVGIANQQPRSKASLMTIPHIVAKTCEKYGEELLKLVEKYGER